MADESSLAEIGKSDETEKLPGLTIKIPSVEEEFERVWSYQKRQDYYEDLGIKLDLPNNAVFKEGTKEEARHIFESEIYDPEFYVVAQVALEEAKPAIEAMFPKFLGLNKAWGFYVPEDYTILLTRYGTGGSYYVETGQVTMKANQDGTFMRGNSIHTPIHEMVHIGVEDTIVKANNLSHGEKERLVDLLCATLLEGEIPPYKLQKNEATKLDQYVTVDTLSNLPQAVEKYLTEKRN